MIIRQATKTMTVLLSHLMDVGTVCSEIRSLKSLSCLKSSSDVPIILDGLLRNYLVKYLSTHSAQSRPFSLDILSQQMSGGFLT